MSRGFPPSLKKPLEGWQCVHVVKRREGGRVVEVNTKVVYGDDTTLEFVGGHTSCVERTNLTSRHINGRLVRKTLSFSKELEMYEASSVREDVVYNLTRPVRTLRVPVTEEKHKRKYQRRSPAMAAGLTDQIWTINELPWVVAPPRRSTQSG
ncbi:MAG: hypothetical protein ACKV2V_08165 [Blastocatellia bacterium]